MNIGGEISGNNMSGGAQRNLPGTLEAHARYVAARVKSKEMSPAMLAQK